MMNSRFKQFAFAVAAVVGIGAAAALVVWLRRPPRPAVPPVRRFSAEETRQLLDAKTLALGQLENALFAESFAGFDALAQSLPEERLPVQNRLLGLLWALRDRLAYAEDPNDPGRRAATIAQAAQTLAQLGALGAEPALLHFLEARLALQRDDSSAALEHLKQAAVADPQNVIYPAAMYEILSQDRDAASQEAARQALETAWRLAPDNLYLVRKYALMLARQQDPRLPEALERLRAAYAPFFGTLQDQLRFDMNAAIDAALAAVREGNWQRALGQVMFADNASTRLPAQQFDAWRLNPHELEFVAYDFSPAFYAAADLPPTPAPAPIPVTFSPAPPPRQLPAMSDALAVRLADFDLDGRWDVIVLRPRRLEVYGRNADDAPWRELAAVELPEGMTGVAVADLDRDILENLPLAAAAPPDAKAPVGETPQCLLADVDLIVYGAGGVRVFKNVYDRATHTRTLQPAPPDEALAALSGVLAVAVADVDHDGDLDLIASSADGMSLWSNRENFTFENITQHSQPPPAAFAATTIVPVDWDRDVYLDLILANAAGEAGVWKNYGHRNFRWEPFAAPEASQAPRPPDVAEAAAPAAGVLDADGNVAWDRVIAGPQGVSLVLNANPRAGAVSPIKTTQITSTPTRGLLLWDYDNDGHQDLLTWGAAAPGAFRGLPEGTFSAVENLFAAPPATIRNAHAADLDRDGDLDLVLETAAGPTIYANEGGNAHAWLSLSLGADREAQLPRERVNMHGVGSLLELRAGPLYQARVADGQIVHLGLGERERADLVRILWTNGVPQNVLQPAAGASLCAEQSLKGSCPYVYTWDGRQWTFFTDCLWSAPIGLQFARGVLAPAREWEYLTVPGAALPDHDGQYRLLVTEELWEAAYLDEIRLIAVDHPDDVEIFSNEKVGPAEIAEFRIHAVRHPRTPRAARNHRGRDVLDEIARRDKKFVQLFDVGHRQGLVEPHFLELDLGDLDQPRQITLFLSGWTWPTDTSLNVAIDENPDLAGPQPPSLWVPNERGEWIEAIPYVGFPGGKTKTIAVDLSTAFPTRDYRVRVQTSMEIYWDAAFFSVDEQAAPTRQQEAPLVAAELFYRGFSHRGPREHLGPETYDASRCDPAPHWPPMLGRFTRYGDATDLVRQRDDRLAVLGAGDALEVRFQKPPYDPPPGWQRDFLLYNVGWDKDADLNTVMGQTVEPLPFTAMPSYPLPATQADPDSPEQRTYCETYQTREQPRAAFWRAVRDAK